jgi:hypothetical protein
MAASMAAMSWSVVAVEGQAVAGGWGTGDCAWRVKVKKAAARVRKRIERSMRGF